MTERNKETGLQSCNHVGSLHDYDLNNWEALGTIRWQVVIFENDPMPTEDTTSKS